MELVVSGEVIGTAMGGRNSNLKGASLVSGRFSATLLKLRSKRVKASERVALWGAVSCVKDKQA